jgi:8-oxo-dGTP diphosphatase
MHSINNHIIPKNAFGYHRTEIPLLNSVDCVVFGFRKNALHVLLVKFPYEPHQGQWSLIGGFVMPHIDMDISARITVEKMTGIENVYMEQVRTFGQINRVPSERVITTCYYALINVEPTLPILTKEHEATWFSIHELPGLVYDHQSMYDAALHKLHEKVLRQPIGFELLPEKFTMYQLLKLYESILDKKMDKRNFHKKIMKMNLLEKLDEKDTENSKRGAFYYKFDLIKYQNLVNEGFSFL